MPWEFEPEGWYAFARGSSIHIRKGPKNYLAYVSIYNQDSLDRTSHYGKFKGRDLETVALRALSYLVSKTGRTPVQIDLAHSEEYPVRVRTEDDEVREIVGRTGEDIRFSEDFRRLLDREGGLGWTDRGGV